MMAASIYSSSISYTALLFTYYSRFECTSTHWTLTYPIVLLDSLIRVSNNHSVCTYTPTTICPALSSMDMHSGCTYPILMTIKQQLRIFAVTRQEKCGVLAS